MCNIAGYIGSRPAAPILVDMMRRQEGWDCGHYTGMATLDAGKLHMRKVVGNLDMFLERCDLEELPGNMGFIHGRTPGVDGERDDRWAHPFVANGGRMAYVVNGAGGAFRNREGVRDLSNALYMELRSKGYQYVTLTEYTNRPKNQRPDGYFIHSSEHMAQVVQSYTDNGMNLIDACHKASLQMPSERVGLYISEDYPDSIIWCRMNYPMFVGKADHGMYLATTPQAIPEDARNIELLMPLAVGQVFADRVETRPMLDTDITVASITPGVWKACYEAMEKALTESEMHHDALDKLIRNLFPPATCPPESAVNYAIMDYFERTGRLQIRKTFVPGTAPGSQAPKIFAKLIG